MDLDILTDKLKSDDDLAVNIIHSFIYEIIGYESFIHFVQMHVANSEPTIGLTNDSDHICLEFYNETIQSESFISLNDSWKRAFEIYTLDDNHDDETKEELTKILTAFKHLVSVIEKDVNSYQVG